jgi:hypothetical protein
MDALFLRLFGNEDKRFSSRDLRAIGFDDSNPPESDYG